MSPGGIGRLPYYCQGLQLLLPCLRGALAGFASAQLFFLSHEHFNEENNLLINYAFPGFSVMFIFIYVI